MELEPQEMSVYSENLNPQDSSLGTKRSIISQPVMQQISLIGILCQAMYAAMRFHSSL